MKKNEKSDENVSREILTAFGWEMGDYHKSSPLSSHIIYIRDFRNKHTQLFTIDVKDIDDLKVPPETSADDYVSFIGEAMRKLKHDRLSELENKALAPTIACYIKQTQGYQRWLAIREADERLHLLMNIYRDPKNVVTIRPMVVRPDTIMLSAAEAQEFTAQIKSQDKKNHPEWFY